MYKYLEGTDKEVVEAVEGRLHEASLTVLIEKNGTPIVESPMNACGRTIKTQGSL